MSRAVLASGMTGLAYRTAQNDNFTELYADVATNDEKLDETRDIPDFTSIDFAPLEQFKGIGSRNNEYSKLALNSSSKKGLLSIRIDNPYLMDIEGEMPRFISLLEKYNVKCLIAENIEENILRNSSEFKVNEYKMIQRGGHEVGDTTPSDSCDYFKIPTGYESIFTPYVGNGIVEIVDATPYKIAILERTHLKELSELKIGATNGYSITAGTDKVTGDFSSLADTNYYLYIDNLTGAKIGWMPLKTVAAGEAHIKTVDGRAVSFAATETLSMYAQAPSVLDVILTESATYLLFLAGQCWFHYIGLTKPNCWIHPGGMWARITDEHAMTAMKNLGMTFSDTYDATIQTLTYNYQRDNIYSGHTWDSPSNELSVDEIFSSGDIETTKAYIADAVARHWHVTIKTHTYFESMTGDDDAAKIENYLTKWDELLKWLFEQNIKIVTYSEMRYLMIDANTDSKANIIPNLFTDTASQSKPDGYELGASATWVNNDGANEDKNNSIKLNGNGELFTITNLGGLEKGLNDFNIWIKGTVGAIVTIQFGSIGSSVFTIADTGWNRLNISAATSLTSLNIPYDTNYLTITATASNNVGNDIQVSGIELKKK